MELLGFIAFVLIVNFLLFVVRLIRDPEFKLIRLFQIVWGLAWIVIGIVAGVAWIVFCAGSVLGIILILIFAPPLLFMPFGLSFYGLAVLMRGIAGDQD